MAKLSSLIVDLQADTAALKSGLDEAKKMIGGLEKKVDQATKAVAAMFLLEKAKDAVVGLAKFVHAGAEAADQAGKMATAAGITTESFSRLSYAADLADISNEELGASLAKLNKQMGEAAAGGKQQAALFSALGVSVTGAGGKIRAADEVLGDLAEKFSQMEDGAAKAALAQEVFGKSGARLIPLLNEGRAGLKNLAEEADRFGFTVSGKGAESANQFNDALTKMKKMGEGLARSVAQELAPSFAALADELVNSTKQSGSMKVAAEGMAAVLRTLASAGVVAAGMFTHVGVTIAGLAAAATSLAQGNLKGAKAALQSAADEMGKNFDNISARLKAIWTTDSGAEAAAEKEKKIVSASADAIIKDIERKKKALEDYKTSVEKFSKITTDLQFQTVTFGFNEVELLEARLLMGDLSTDLKKAGDEGAKFADKLLEAAKALRQLKMEQKAKDAVAGMKQSSLVKDSVNFASNTPQMIAPKGLRAGTDLKVAAKVVDAAIAMERQVRAAFAAAGAHIARGLMSATQSLLGAMGGIGSIIGNFVETAANEGIWEAIIGAIGQIVQAAPAFAQVVDMAAGILQHVVGSLNGLIEGIGHLVGALGWVIELVINTLNPVFDALGTVLSDLAPLLYIMSSTIQITLVPVAKALGGVLKLLSPVLRGVFEVVKGIVLISFYIMRALAGAWNAVVGAISGVLRAISKFEILGARPFGFLENWANTVDKAQITTGNFEQQIKDLENATFDSVKEQQLAKEEQYKAAGAAEKMTKSMDNASKAAAGLTNIPALLKVNRLRGLAMDTAGGQQNFNLYIDGKEIYTVVEKQKQKSDFNKNGGRSGF